jgi:hypothetical protein
MAIGTIEDIQSGKAAQQHIVQILLQILYESLYRV